MKKRETYNDYVALEPIREEVENSFETDKTKSGHVFQPGKVMYTNSNNKSKEGDVVLYNKTQASDQIIDGMKLKLVREINLAIKL